MEKETPEMIELRMKHRALLYKTSGQAVGETAQDAFTKPAHGINGGFTNHLIYSGMPKVNGLNTKVDNDRYVDGSKDWMDKLA